MRIINVSGFVLLFCLFSCKTETVTCFPAGIQIGFVGFTYDEVKNITVLGYKKDNLFDSLVDSGYWQCQQNGTSDTLMFFYTLDDDHDYRVKLPDTNTVYSITGLTLGNHYSEKYRTGLSSEAVVHECRNNTVSYTLNGQQFGQPNVMSGIYNVVYINK